MMRFASGRLDYSYTEFGRIEESFHAALDESLRPPRAELLYDLVRDMGLRPGSRVVDVGCGDGRHSVELAKRFQLDVTGVDPFPRLDVDHVADLERAYAEFRRVLRPGGRALVYQAFAGDRLEPREAEFL